MIAMYLELHLLQNFAPSNLNRDDTGSPKECVFGGVTRARISSQCLKRAARTYFHDSRLFSQEELGTRTLRTVQRVAELLVTRGVAEDEGRMLVASVLTGLGIAALDDRERGIKTDYLLFLGEREMQWLANFCATHREALAPLADQYRTLVAQGVTDEEQEDVETTTPTRRGRPINKKALKKRLGEALKQAGLPPEDVRRNLDGGRAVDVALFGRMIADLPDNSPDGVCQVAHAFSTHQVAAEEDFYTAVDDLLPRGETGAGMMGTMPYNSACYYRYANVDLTQLAANLRDGELAARTAEAFLQASVLAIPTGKQTSTAAQNPPSFVMGVVRDAGLWSLANAFERPVRPSEDRGLVESSILALDRQWGKLATMYGTAGIQGVWLVEHEGAPMPYLGRNRVNSMEELAERVLAALRAGVIA